MRKITEQSAKALLNHERFMLANTRTQQFNSNTSLYLFDNLIAVKDKQGDLRLSLAGHNTTTTKERLNGILELACLNWRYRTIKGKAYLVHLETGTKLRIDDNRFYSIAEMAMAFFKKQKELN